MLSPEEGRAAFAAAAEQFATALADGDLDLPVPTCPGWTTRELVRHLGSVHRWAAECIRTNAPADEPEGPTQLPELLAWFTEGAYELGGVLSQRDPDGPTWTFGPHPRTVAFWCRRQAHETTMHLWDLDNAQGRGEPIDAVLAADGIDEVASMFFPRQVRLQRIAPLSTGIRLVATDVPDCSVVIAGDGTDPAAVVVATAHAPASDLLLGLWGRRGWGDWQVDGDPAAVSAVLTAGIVP